MGWSGMKPRMVKTDASSPGLSKGRSATVKPAKISLRKFQKKLIKPKNSSKDFVSNTNYLKFVDGLKEGKPRINRTAIADAERKDGFFGVITTELKWIQMPVVTHLDLSNTNCAGIPFNTLTPNLKKINLFRTSVKGGDVQALSKIETLEVINLSESQVGKSAITFLSNLSNLKKIDLSLNNVAGGAFDKLKNLQNLEELNLSWGYCLDRDDLLKLAELKQLKKLNLTSATNFNVNSTHLEALKAALPETEVIW